MTAGLAAILPVLTAGFLFVVIHYKTRLLASHAEGQRLFFMCAASGLALSALAHLILAATPAGILAHLAERIPDSHDRQHALTFLLGPVAACLANLFYAIYYWLCVDAESKSHASTAWEWAISAHVRRSGNPMRRMLVQAVDSNGEQLVLLSLGSRKVYCGAVRRLPAPTPGEEFIEVIPMFSVTRNKDSLQFEHRIDYPAFHLWRLKQRIALLQKLIGLASGNAEKAGEREAIEAELKDRQTLLASVAETAPAGYTEKLDIDLWSKVIPVREIESISFYDEEGNDKWFRSEPPAPSTPSPPPAPTPDSPASAGSADAVPPGP